MSGVVIKSAMMTAAQHLAAISSTPHLDAELLLAQVLQLTRAQLHARSQQLLTARQQYDFQQLLQRRQRGEPIAYLLGYQEFWSLPLMVTPDTLIPRPETELLVELVLQKLPAVGHQRVADLGTGSGAIALAIAHECPHWSVVATDCSVAALQVAQYNAERLQINTVDFYQGDWCQPLVGQHFNAIISNPPYIRTDDSHLDEAEMGYEPKLALIAGQEGLQHLRTVISQAMGYLLPGGWLLLEHGYDQTLVVRDWLMAGGYKEIAAYPDLGGIERVAVGRKP